MANKIAVRSFIGNVFAKYAQVLTATEFATLSLFTIENQKP